MSQGDSAPDRKIPFQFPKNLGGGNFKRICKGIFLVGSSGRETPARRRGRASALRAKIVSSVIVKGYQKSTILRFRAFFARFFYSCAERRPYGFRGEKFLEQP